MSKRTPGHGLRLVDDIPHPRSHLLGKIVERDRFVPPPLHAVDVPAFDEAYGESTAIAALGQEAVAFGELKIGLRKVADSRPEIASPAEVVNERVNSLDGPFLQCGRIWLRPCGSCMCYGKTREDAPDPSGEVTATSHLLPHRATRRRP